MGFRELIRGVFSLVAQLTFQVNQVKMVGRVVFVSLLSLILNVLIVSGRDPRIVLRRSNSKGHTFVKVDLRTGLKDADDYCRSQGWSLPRLTDIPEDFILLDGLTSEDVTLNIPDCIGTWVDAMAVFPDYTFTDVRGSKFNYKFPYQHQTACWYKCCGVAVCATGHRNTDKYTLEDGCGREKFVVCNATNNVDKIPDTVPEEPNPSPDPIEEFERRLQRKIEKSRNEITKVINSLIDRRFKDANRFSDKSKEEARKMVTKGLSSISCKDHHKDLVIDLSDLKKSEKKAMTDLDTNYIESIGNLKVKKNMFEREVKSLTSLNISQAEKKYTSEHREMQKKVQDLEGDVHLIQKDKNKEVAKARRQITRKTSNLKKEFMKYLEDEIEKMNSSKFLSDEDLNTAVDKVLSLADNQEKIKNSRVSKKEVAKQTDVSLIWKIFFGLVLSLDFVLVIATVLGYRQLRLLKETLGNKKRGSTNRFVVRFKNLNETAPHKVSIGKEID